MDPAAGPQVIGTDKSIVEEIPPVSANVIQVEPTIGMLVGRPDKLAAIKGIFVILVVVVSYLPIRLGLLVSCPHAAAQLLVLSSVQTCKMEMLTAF